MQGVTLPFLCVYVLEGSAGTRGDRGRKVLTQRSALRYSTQLFPGLRGLHTGISSDSMKIAISLVGSH